MEEKYLKIYPHGLPGYYWMKLVYLYHDMCVFPPFKPLIETREICHSGRCLWAVYLIVPITKLIPSNVLHWSIQKELQLSVLSLAES